MGIRVTRHQIKTLPTVGFVGYLQAVITRALRIPELGVFAKESKWAEERPTPLLTGGGITFPFVKTFSGRHRIWLGDVEQA